jgi:hypothetical protein
MTTGPAPAGYRFLRGAAAPRSEREAGRGFARFATRIHHTNPSRFNRRDQR